jgi:hypothetical protein
LGDNGLLCTVVRVAAPEPLKEATTGVFFDAILADDRIPDGEEMSARRLAG